MAGFYGTGFYPNKLNNITNTGKVTPETLLLNNSQAIGYIEGELKRRGAYTPGAEDLLSFSAAIADTTSGLHTKSLAFFQLDYKVKKERLRDIAANSEIEFVLETIANDTIVYDDNNMFVMPFNISDFIQKKGVENFPKIYQKYQDKIINVYEDAFYNIYDAWGFYDGISAWKIFYQWLIEGNIAYEIIYDNVINPKKIIGFKEIDPSTVYPIIDKDTNGQLILKWIQKSPYDSTYKELSDNQIIYISYSNSFKSKRVSFTERMIRSFNLLRIIEQSKVMWHIMMSPVRMKTRIPIGTKSFGKALNDVKEYLNTYKEDVFFNADTGELLVDGKPKVLYYKNYIIPKNSRGEEIDIESVEHKGPNLENSELLNYFLKKLKLDSKLPFSRWDYNEGGGSYLLGPDTVSREEISYGKLIKRFRSAFQEVLIKPIYLQMCLDYPTLKKDLKLKNLLSVRYVDENVFEDLKKSTLIKQRVETINSLLEVKENNDSYFNIDTLVKKFLKWSDGELNDNKTSKILANLENKEKGEENGEGDESGDEGGMGGLLKGAAQSEMGGEAQSEMSGEAQSEMSGE